MFNCLFGTARQNKLIKMIQLLKQLLKNFGGMLYLSVVFLLLGYLLNLLFLFVASLRLIEFIVLSFFIGLPGIISILVVLPFISIPAKLLIKDSTVGKVMCTISVLLSGIVYFVYSKGVINNIIQDSPPIANRLILSIILSMIIMLIIFIVSIVIICQKR